MKYENLIEHIFLAPDKEVQIPRESLDSTVFQFFDDGRPPVLQDSIKAQIITDVQSLEQVAPITGFYLVGDILTPYYVEATNMDVYIELDPEVVDNISTAGLFYNIRRLNGRFATNTTHRVYYHLHTQHLDEEAEEAVYDIINERWPKRPSATTPRLEEFITKFNETMLSIDNETGELLRDRLEIQEIKKLTTADIQTIRYYVQKKYDRLVENLENVVKLFPDEQAIERLLNDNTLTVLEIKLIGQSIPDFIRVMFFEKFYVVKFIQTLDDLLVDDDEFDVRALVNTNEMGKHFKKAN